MEVESEMNSVFHIGLLTMLGICAVMDCMYRRVWMPLTGIMLCYTVIACLLYTSDAADE